MLIDEQQNELSIPVDAEPRDVQVDPGLCVPLMQATFEKTVSIERRTAAVGMGKD